MIPALQTIELLNSCSRCSCPRATGPFLLPVDDILGSRYSISSKVQLCFTDLNCRITGDLDVQPESLDGFSSFHEWQPRRKDLSVGRIYTVDLVKGSLAYNLETELPVCLPHCSANVVRRNHIHLPSSNTIRQDRLR